MNRLPILWKVLIGLATVFLLVFAYPNSKTDSQGLFATDDIETSDLHPVEQFVVDGSINSINEAFKVTDKVFYPEDKITAFPDPKLGLGSVITIQRALPLTIKDGRKSYSIRTWLGSIEEVLAQNRLELGQDDRIAPALSTPLSPNLSITITRVARTTVTEKETINFKTEERNDPEVWRGERRTIQEGKNGERTKQFLVIREDGEIVSRTLVSNVVSIEPINRVIVVGTKVRVDQSRTRTGVASHYGQAFFGSGNIASNYLRRGTRVLITNLNNGRRIEGVVNDFMEHPTRVIDLSPELFTQLGAPLSQGLINNVKVEVIIN